MKVGKRGKSSESFTCGRLTDLDIERSRATSHRAAAHSFALLNCSRDVCIAPIGGMRACPKKRSLCMSLHLLWARTASTRNGALPRRLYMLRLEHRSKNAAALGHVPSWANRAQEATAGDPTSRHQRLAQNQQALGMAASSGAVQDGERKI